MNNDNIEWKNNRNIYLNYYKNTKSVLMEH